MKCQLWRGMTSQWRHKPAILNFEADILNSEPAVMVDNDDIEKYMILF